MSAPPAGAGDRRTVSTGTLPDPATVQSILDEAYQRFRDVTDGTVSNVYPALAAADPADFALALVGVGGRTFVAGETGRTFTPMSCAKPFVFALAAQQRGVDDVVDRVGVDATGLPFNSATAVERDPAGRTNPMVNSGALTTTALLADALGGSGWEGIRAGLSRFAGRNLELDDVTYASASATNQRNLAIALLLHSRGAYDRDPAEVTDLYTRQSCVRVTAVDLAVMAATLADGGVNPITGEQVVAAEVARATLAVMTVAGLYETSGQWLLRVGLPAKSGISGALVTVSPGKGGLATYAPPLDAAGNSVRGGLVAQHLARRLGLDVLASQVAR